MNSWQRGDREEGREWEEGGGEKIEEEEERRRIMKLVYWTVSIWRIWEKGASQQFFTLILQVNLKLFQSAKCLKVSIWIL